jgi:hypothetical protein
MMKKILLWGALAVLVGLLIFGAVNRTIAKSSDEGYGSGREVLQNNTDIDNSQERNGRDQDNLATAQGGQYGRNGQGNRADSNPTNPDENGIGQAEVSEVVELVGIITAVDETTLTIFASNQQSIEVSGRAWEYAQESGFSVQVGDQVEVTGFYEGETLEVISLKNLTANQELVLRDANGRPMWAGWRRGG